jgi:hypothetical protein
VRPSDRGVRIGAALVVALGLAASALAILAGELGLSAGAPRGVFGWKRIVLLVAGGAATAFGALLVARPRIVSRRADSERIRDYRRRVSPSTARRVRAAITSTWFLGAAIALFTWAPQSVLPSPGLDQSWKTALNMAAHERLDFGSDLIFSFGPLGFLHEPQVSYTGTAIAGGVYQVGLALAIAVSLLWAARRSFPLPVAVLLAFLASSLLVREEALLSIAFVWCVVWAGPDPPPVARPLIVYGGALASAFGLLYKLNVGIGVLAMVAVAVVALDGQRRRNVLAFCGAFSAALLGLWLAAGQGVANVIDYANGAVEITGGYSTAMGVTPGPRLEIALLEIAFVVGAALYVGVKLPRVRFVALMAIVLLFCAMQLKSGLVRGDWEHYPRFFAAMLVPWLAFRWMGRERLVALLAMAAVTVVAVAIAERSVTDARPEARDHVIRPLQSPRAAVSETRTLLDAGRRSEARDSARNALRDHYGVDRIDPRILTLLEGHGVHVDPWEASLIWAYELDWDPLPVFQRYSVYTSELDRENADVLASEGGPSRILRHGALGVVTTSSIDHRYGPFEAPAQTLAMLCNFRPLLTTLEYQVLGRTANRCAGERPLRTVEAAYDEQVVVPQAPGGRQIVIARVEGLEPSRVEELLTPLVRSEPRFVTFDGGEEWRVVPATARNGLVLSAPPRVDFPSPWGVTPRTATISFSKGDEPPDPKSSLRIEFASLRAAPFEFERRR